MIHRINAMVLNWTKKTISKLGILKAMKPPLVRRQIATVLLLALVFTCMGMFTTTAKATDSNPISAENLAKAYFVYYEGQSIGLVKDRSDVTSILEAIRKEFEAKYHMEAMLLYDIEFEEVYIEDRYLSSMDKMESVIRANVKPRVKATILEIDGQEMGILKDESDIDVLSEALKKSYIDGAEVSGIKLLDIGFEEEITTKSDYVDYERVENTEEVIDRLSKSQVGEEVYAVEEGDNVWTIAKKHGIKVKELLDANAPMKESDILQIGQELKLNLPEFPINVMTVEEDKYTETIDFETEKKKDNSLLVGETKVSREGEDGEMELVEKVYKRNGIETHREKVSEKVTKEPVNKIVLVGTKKPVRNQVSSRGSRGGSSSGGGSLSWPTSGRISSGFGKRGGRMHKGIDIAGPKGTPVYAAAGGSVISSGYSGSYGNLVKISHGDGMVTYYAHLNSRVVGQGEGVSRGQLIGYMGSTGRSTGPHLHFEVRISGNPKNPKNYLR